MAERVPNIHRAGERASVLQRLDKEADTQEALVSEHASFSENHPESWSVHGTMASADGRIKLE